MYGIRIRGKLDIFLVLFLFCFNKISIFSMHIFRFNRKDHFLFLCCGILTLLDKAGSFRISCFRLMGYVFRAFLQDSCIFNKLFYNLEV